MSLDSCINQGEITNADDLRSTFRQAVGALIWVHQTRPDIGFTITQMSTSSVAASKSVEEAKDLCRKYNKIVKFMKNHPRKIHYTRIHTLTGLAAIEDLMTWRIIAFSDAGFASLTNQYSVEGNFLILGRILSRDGIINCHGGIIDHRCAKIHRVCRSSLSAETNAAITATDWSLWFQVLFTELFTQEFNIRRICPPTSFPLRNPFGASPSDGQIKTEINMSGKTYYAILYSNESERQPEENQTKLILYCSKCERQVILIINDSECSADISQSPIYSAATISPVLFKPLILTDCCSLFSCVIKLQPNTLERCSLVLIAYLRDMQSLITFSFID